LSLSAAISSELSVKMAFRNNWGKSKINSN
jgi:hypothetical protein